MRKGYLNKRLLTNRKAKIVTWKAFPWPRLSLFTKNALVTNLSLTNSLTTRKKLKFVLYRSLLSRKRNQNTLRLSSDTFSKKKRTTTLKWLRNSSRSNRSWPSPKRIQINSHQTKFKNSKIKNSKKPMKWISKLTLLKKWICSLNKIQIFLIAKVMLPQWFSHKTLSSLRISYSPAPSISMTLIL